MRFAYCLQTGRNSVDTRVMREDRLEIWQRETVNMWEEEKRFIVLKCAELREVGHQQDGRRAAYPITHGHNY